MTPKYPQIRVTLTGTNGNAFAVLAAASRAMRSAAIDKAERDAFFAEATAGDYAHLLQTAMRWVEVV
jgi:hypothetical protein